MMRNIILLSTLLIGFAISSNAQKKKKAKDGYYFNLQGNKKEAKLYYALPVASTSPSEPGETQGKLFAYKNGKKIGKFKADDIQSFVIEGDSLTSIPVFYGKKKAKPAFAKTAVNGEMILYYIPVSYQVGGGKGMESMKFAYRRKGDDNARILFLKNWSIKKLCEAISDNPKIAKQIMDEKKMKLMSTLASYFEDYNKWHEAQQ